MRCPACGKTEDKVLETRTTNNGSAMRRRRVCLACGYRFTSYERVEDKPIIVVKKNGDIQNFDLSKVERSIRICTDKRNITNETIENLINNIDEAIKLQAGPKHEVSSSLIFIKEIESLAPKAEG